MVKGSITMRWATLGIEEEEKVDITIKRGMVEGFTSVLFSLARVSVPHYYTTGLFGV
jgi:hypothetical protein